MFIKPNKDKAFRLTYNKEIKLFLSGKPFFEQGGAFSTDDCVQVYWWLEVDFNP